MSNAAAVGGRIAVYRRVIEVERAAKAGDRAAPAIHRGVPGKQHAGKRDSPGSIKEARAVGAGDLAAADRQVADVDGAGADIEYACRPATTEGDLSIAGSERVGDRYALGDGEFGYKGDGVGDGAQIEVNRPAVTHIDERLTQTSCAIVVSAGYRRGIAAHREGRGVAGKACAAVGRTYCPRARQHRARLRSRYIHRDGAVGARRRNAAS